MAKYFVNGCCVGCGLCEGTCPNVFHIDSVAAVAIDEEVSAADAESAKEAMECCPVGAIEEV